MFDVTVFLVALAMMVLIAFVFIGVFAAAYHKWWVVRCAGVVIAMVAFAAAFALLIGSMQHTGV